MFYLNCFNHELNNIKVILKPEELMDFTITITLLYLTAVTSLVLSFSWTPFMGTHCKEPSNELETMKLINVIKCELECIRKIIFHFNQEEHEIWLISNVVIHDGFVDRSENIKNTRC
jgi:hypothetical protein